MTSVDDTYMKDFTTIKKSYLETKDSILQLKKYKKFYIGVTKDPEERIKDHYNNKELKLKSMFVLCRCQNNTTAKKLEDKLLVRFHNKKNCLNKTQYGGGGVDEGINYIYVAFK
ncbi:MAG: hypothetical protein CMF62_04350 [Magnetococcales bacterium]|nr:hypothetical protein [Magnetococcales bacterium]|tara:strand:+ start:7310 stop:7651 length:342 start_codon:yes stop_codon:yes gene_type:complete